MNVPPRKFIALIWIAALAALALAVACGGGDDDNSGQTGQLSDPQTVPTATEWVQAPDIIVLDPNNIQPLPTDRPVDTTTHTPAASGEPGVCGETYTVVADDTIFGIAEKCGVSPDDLQSANPDVDPHNLHIGDVLVLPQASEEPTATP
ncbi:MAG TPA: LysM peptidoglycan-binding domain-containing protein [Dehalococcoidia bacterium]|nr:LysM peptidoglycan-binding domain-containing protein [Dehalococcoidia bacterium]